MENVTEIIMEATAKLKALSADEIKKEVRYARDWSGFFQAFAAFITTVLPLVLPLFSEKSE